MISLNEYAEVLANRLGYSFGMGKKGNIEWYVLINIKTQDRVDYRTIDGLLNFLALKEEGL